MAEENDLVNLIFDGPPTTDDQEGPRFIVGELPDGEECKVGGWYEDEHGRWVMQITAKEIHALNHPSDDNMTLEQRADMAIRKMFEVCGQQINWELEKGAESLLEQIKQHARDTMEQAEKAVAYLSQKKPNMHQLFPIPIGDEDIFAEMREEMEEQMVRQLSDWSEAIELGKVIMQKLSQYESRPQPGSQTEH